MKILIAEDDNDISLTYEAVLVDRGHQVVLTNNGKDCLLKYKETAFFDAVILDFLMPIMDGYEAAKEILKINPNQRIIFASAYGRETFQELAKQGGISVEILQKPFDLQTLTDTLEDETRIQKTITKG